MKKGWRIPLIYLGFCFIVGIVALVFTLTGSSPSINIDPVDQAKEQAMIENYEKLKTNYPLIEYLPIKVDRFLNYSKHIRYDINYRIEDDKAIIIIYDYTGENYENALSNIRNRGFEPDDYEIEYIDSESDIDL